MPPTLHMEWFAATGALSGGGWLIAALAAGAAALVGRRVQEGRSVRRRLGDQVGARTTSAGDTSGGSVELFDSRLEEWLFVSGFRAENAQRSFLWAQAIAVVLGAAVALLIARSGILATARGWLEGIPGGIGDLFSPIMTLATWILFVLVALVPVTYVRKRRREIVAATERDLPIALGLLATLVESGVGFDAALDRVRHAMGADRPLGLEFQTFRSESRGGVPRVVSFRRIAQRLEIPAVTVFISAMIHAEHVGASIADTLRQQAEEVWSRRRERAIQRAQTLPTKLAFPLVICFLPGVFVWTFGPAVAEFLRIADGVLQQSP